MAFYRECPRCGCSLDPGEKCDCQETDEQKKIEAACYRERALKVFETRSRWSDLFELEFWRWYS